MPKYYEFKVCGYYLYFTAHCIVECMYAHASDRKLTEGGSAKLFVKSNGDTVVQNRGILSERELKKIQELLYLLQRAAGKERSYSPVCKL
ncbi:hypothetical protein [Zhenpiania hominis]|uniref:DUF4160 domain-containing protein n=1 Tax=Zhenpiania hominis TaxID=2763644 RepID=A0A923NNB6_9FIRM|nr:hypothetical protein [Zhenpiania hominis]MBC6679730.1 hypothetical protein [Zhenpiania hominis]